MAKAEWRLLAAAAAVLSAFSTPVRPNILLLMADQLRFDYVNGEYGQVFTPSLQRLAAEGCRFTKAYTSTPTCTPARAAILTGLSPWNHGMLGYGSIAPAYQHELPRMMVENGYSATIIGKNHFILANNTVPTHGYQNLSLYDGLGNGLANGTEFDTYDRWFQQQLPGSDPLATGALDWNSWNGAPYAYDEYYHPTAWTGRLAVQFLQNHARRAAAMQDTQPFFLKVSFHRPHSPYDPPARWLNNTPAYILPTQHVDAAWDLRYRGGPQDPPGCGPSDWDAWCGKMPDANLTLGRRAYAANVRFVDEWIGTILDTLEAENLLNSTFILFVSDHGDGQGDHYLFRKMYPYEISAHVPMLVRWPDNFDAAMPRNSSSDLVTELRDILPTFLDVAGAYPAANASFDGLPLTCILRDPSGSSCGCEAEDATAAGASNNDAVHGDTGTSDGNALADSSEGCSGWRDYVDMEHDITYNETQHWNGLTDGKMKYIFQAFFAAEQLFNLTADPYEMADLAGDPAYKDVLAVWRGRLVAQFEREQRGPSWVQNGALQRRVQGQLYSPNYPGPTSKAAPDGPDGLGTWSAGLALWHDMM